MGSFSCCVANSLVKADVPVQHHAIFKRKFLPVISFDESSKQIHIIQPKLSQSFDLSYRSKSSNSNVSLNSSYDSTKTHESDNEYEQVKFKIKKSKRIRFNSRATMDFLNLNETKRRESRFSLQTPKKKSQIKQPFQIDLEPNHQKEKLEIKLLENKIDLIKKDEEIRILIIGTNQSGKSSFVYKAIKGKFSKVYIPRIGVENEGRIFNECGSDRAIRFYVLPSEEQFSLIYKQYYENTHLILIFYDISVKGSFEQSMTIFKKYKEYIPGLIIEDKVKNFLFVGNKADFIERKESLEMIKNICDENKYDFNEISVKTGKGLKCLLNSIINKFECIKNINQYS